MKKLIVFVMIALAGLSLEAKGVLNKVVYVTSLECENCAKKIRENIAFEKGVKDLSVDVKTRTVEIQFDPAKTDTLQLRKALNKLGYRAKVVEYR